MKFTTYCEYAADRCSRNQVKSSRRDRNGAAEGRSGYAGDQHRCEEENNLHDCIFRLV